MDIVMDPLERREIYEMAMRRMDEHIVKGSDGLFVLKLDNPSDLGIDPIAFADLQRSLEETNKKIKLGQVKVSEIR